MTTPFQRAGRPLMPAELHAADRQPPPENTSGWVSILSPLIVLFACIGAINDWLLGAHDPPPPPTAEERAAAARTDSLGHYYDSLYIAGEDLDDDELDYVSEEGFHARAARDIESWTSSTEH